MPVIINPDVIRNELVFPGMEQSLNGGIQFLLVGAFILIVASVFRKRIKNQNENELTV